MSTRWPWSLTPPWCAEEREPLHAESNYFLKRRLATFDSVGIWVPSQGPTQVKQIKAQEMETSSPRPLPSSQGTQVALWCPILAQFRRERGEWYISGRVGVIVQLVWGRTSPFKHLGLIFPVCGVFFLSTPWQLSCIITSLQGLFSIGVEPTAW